MSLSLLRLPEVCKPDEFSPQTLRPELACDSTAKRLLIYTEIHSLTHTNFLSRAPTPTRRHYLVLTLLGRTLLLFPLTIASKRKRVVANIN